MPLTPVWSIFYRNTLTPAALETESALQATSIENALNTIVASRAINTYKWANTAARNAQTGMSQGDTGDQLDNNTMWRYSGTTWLQVGPAGLVPIVPTAVSGTGVSVSTTGRVTFTGSTTVNVRGCFSSEFDNYRLIFDNPTTSVSNSVTVQLANGGTAVSSANYDQQKSVAVGGSIVGAATMAGTSWNLVNGDRADKLIIMDIVNPGIAKRTIGNSITVDTDAAANYGYVSIGLRHRLSTAYDGIIFTISTGTATGTLRVYGYNNN